MQSSESKSSGEVTITRSKNEERKQLPESTRRKVHVKESALRGRVILLERYLAIGDLATRKLEEPLFTLHFHQLPSLLEGHNIRLI